MGFNHPDSQFSAVPPCTSVVESFHEPRYDRKPKDNNKHLIILGGTWPTRSGTCPLVPLSGYYKRFTCLHTTCR
jgi:hypothetical protein